MTEAGVFGRILLTGGGGFVGGYLAPALTAAFPDASKLMLRRPQTTESRDGFAIAEAEIFDHQAIGEIVSSFRPDLIVHLAAQSSVGQSKDIAEETWRVNVEGSFALASACTKNTPHAAFFFVSSAEVYGLSFRDGPVREGAPLQPQNIYARTKVAAEYVLQDVLSNGTKLTIVRPFNHTGPGQDERFVLPSFAAQISRIEKGYLSPEIKVGNLDVERDILDVRDVCDAYIRLIEFFPSLPERNTFNISSGSARSIRSLLEMMRAQARAEFKIVIDPTRLRPSDVPRTVGLNDRLVNCVSWMPNHPIEQTLADLLQAARMSFA